jgi:hypothetical protein
MRQNVGILDSTLRVTLGFALLFVGFLVAEPVKWLAFAGFVILAVTGFVGKCPLYKVFGIDTCARQERHG